MERDSAEFLEHWISPHDLPGLIPGAVDDENRVSLVERKLFAVYGGGARIEQDWLGIAESRLKDAFLKNHSAKERTVYD